MTSPLKKSPIDHVELMVPLLMSRDGGHTLLALFQGSSTGDTSKHGFRRVAFGASGDEFVAWSSGVRRAFSR